MIHINSCEMGFVGSICYVVHDDNKNGFMVDPGDSNDSLISFLKDEKIDLKYIILTHGHGDHIGGIDSVKEVYPNAKIIAHRDEKELLNDPEQNMSRAVCRRRISMDADMYIGDGETLSVGEAELKFIHTPGHSKGSMCILMKDTEEKDTEGNVILFSGDTLFHQSIGRTDFYGGDFNTISNSIKNKLYILPDETIVLPGHMSPTTIGDEKRYNPFVKA